MKLTTVSFGGQMMINLYFGNLFSILTFILVAGIFTLIAIAIKNRKNIKNWGRLNLLLIIPGLAVSAFLLGKGL